MFDILHQSQFNKKKNDMERDEREYKKTINVSNFTFNI